MMSNDKKLPVSLQFVGLTAVVVFCFSTIGAFNFARALWLNRTPIASLQGSNQIELYAPLVIAFVVCGASVFTFLALIFRTARSAALTSIVYLLLLLLLIALQFFSIAVAHFELTMAPQMLAVWVGIRIAYAAWLIGLLANVWSHCSIDGTLRSR